MCKIQCLSMVATNLERPIKQTKKKKRTDGRAFKNVFFFFFFFFFFFSVLGREEGCRTFIPKIDVTFKIIIE
jgi:hypothetical protein